MEGEGERSEVRPDERNEVKGPDGGQREDPMVLRRDINDAREAVAHKKAKSLEMLDPKGNRNGRTSPPDRTRTPAAEATNPVSTNIADILNRRTNT